MDFLDWDSLAIADDFHPLHPTRNAVIHSPEHFRNAVYHTPHHVPH